MSSNYSFRLAQLSDSENIRSFIRDYWKNDHIYVLDKNYFDYEFVNGNNLNFIITFNESGILSGILGFIKYNLEKNEQIFTVMWKVLANVSDPMLGIKLLKKLFEFFPKAYISTVGANEKTLAIYKYLGFQIGKLKHFVLINNSFEKFKMIKLIEAIQLNNLLQIENEEVFNLELLTQKEIKKYFLQAKNLENSIIIQYESFEKRYLKHPYYTYQIFGIVNNNQQVLNLLVIRELEVDNVKIGRIINLIGEVQNLVKVRHSLNNLVKKNNYEYLDFYQFGIKDEILINAGFIKKDNNLMVVPNFFEPFVSKNIDINFFTTNRNPLLFKGHGDQDRPSIARL